MAIQLFSDNKLLLHRQHTARCSALDTIGVYQQHHLCWATTPLVLDNRLKMGREVYYSHYRIYSKTLIAILYGEVFSDTNKLISQKS